MAGLGEREVRKVFDVAALDILRVLGQLKAMRLEQRLLESLQAGRLVPAVAGDHPGHVCASAGGALFDWPWAFLPWGVSCPLG